MARWEFRQYVQQSGRNRVLKWCDELSTKERAKLDRLIQTLEKLEQWTEPQFKTLSGKHAGLGELRWGGDQNRQLRLLGCRGPQSGQYTLLLGCSHKDRRYTPTDALDTAVAEMKRLKQRIGGTCEHESESD
jgi:hypothetical protein